MSTSGSMGPFSVGPLRVRVRGLDLLDDDRRLRMLTTWAELPRAEAGGAPLLDLEFVDRVHVQHVPALFDPVGHDPIGLHVVDTAGRAAVLPLPDPTQDVVRIDGRINAYVLRSWVWLSLLRIAVERSGGCLVRAAGVSLGDRRIVIAAPRHTGKTRLLLELLRNGGQYLGDDWIALDAEGDVHTVETRLTLRDVHRAQLGRGSPSPRLAAARLVASAAGWTSSRLPALSSWFHRLATAIWSLDFETVPVSDVSSAGLGQPGRITDLVILCPPALPPPAADEVGTVLAALGGLSARADATLASAYAATHPEDPGTLFVPLSEIASRIAAATSEAAIHVVRAEGDWLEPTVERFLPGSGVSPPRG